jgi:hypothetical protein
MQNYFSTRFRSIIIIASSLNSTVLHGAQDIVPGEFHYRDVALDLLAGALKASFDQSGDMMVLSEATTLHQEELRLRPTGHPRRIASLEGLAGLYCKLDPVSWTDAYTLYCEALEICPQGYPSRARLLSVPLGAR